MPVHQKERRDFLRTLGFAGGSPGVRTKTGLQQGTILATPHVITAVEWRARSRSLFPGPKRHDSIFVGFEERTAN